jgi:hypothetical protein
MSHDISKYWTRETDADLTLPDGHKLRLAIEIRRPEWVRARDLDPEEMLPKDWIPPDERNDPAEGYRPVSPYLGWDGNPESRLLLMHDDWPGLEVRLRTARTWQSKIDFNENHVYGLAWLIDKLGESSDRMPPLLCEEFVQAFENMIEGIFPDCDFDFPDEESEEFDAYRELYLGPALGWLLYCDADSFEGIPMIHE